MLKTKINRIRAVDLPNYQTASSAGADLCAAESKIIMPGAIEKIPTGLIIEAPLGYFILITARSSLAIKKGLMLANGVGVIDRDYCGPDDEIMLLLHNFTDSPRMVSDGERLAQAILMRYEQAMWVETAIVKDNRGGIGSTGGYNVYPS